MKLNVKRVEKEGKELILYVETPIFNRAIWLKRVDDYFRDDDNFLGIMIDETGKYGILTFVLRNKEDILLYRK